jgi:carbohydrate-binding DOMON domain-containing protein
MNTRDFRRLLAACALLGGTLAAGVASADGPIKLDKKAGFTMTDPTGDDNGPGTYKYPTNAVYKPGSFDIVEFQVVPGATTTEFRIKVNAKIEDPWDSKSWGGNGFSVQMAFIHIDTDHKAGSGAVEGIPGTHVRFAPAEAWDRVIIVSPQGPPKLASEIELKAASLKSRIVVPKSTSAADQTLIAVVDNAALGGAPKESWGYQVVMQSNEGFPGKKDFLTRKVNESEGEHKFGGGSDYDNDPEVIDILVPPGGDAAQMQHEILSKYNKDATEEVKPEDLAVVPMVYPFAKPKKK